jgi:hypothetical protein
MVRSRVPLVLACLAICGSSGCATLTIPWAAGKFAKATAQNPAVQIVCLWEQAEGRDPDGIPCRGFAGQILFLANRHAAPLEIDGDVRIYLFDNVGSADDQAKPLRQYDFTSEAWRMHLTKSAVGPSYSVFVPYVRRGQANAQCSLRVRLTPKIGPVIFSELTTLPLRGPNVSSETTIISEPGPDERVQAEVSKTLSKVMEKTTTIPLNISHSGSMSIAAKSPTAMQNSSDVASTDDRLARMERLLEHALAERAAGPNAVQPAHYETLAPEPSSDEPPRRFRLDRSDE